MDEYNEAIRQNPNFAKPHFYLARALADRGDSDGAAREYAEAQRLDPRLKPPGNSKIK
jgi:cytochrome c-type biogenesis protein CcmH/NrfG